MPKLGVNVDHVATLRQARREFEPDPIQAARICEKAGANSIVCHLREDRRHINDADVQKLRKIIKTSMTLEMSLNQSIIAIAAKIEPEHALFVPEQRREVTTEGGLDVEKHFNRVKNAIRQLKKKNIVISLFIDPNKKQIKKSKEAGADMVELHTGPYAHAKTKTAKQRELKKLKAMAKFGRKLNIRVSAGHGLKYHDTRPVARIKEIEELNIGHSIVSRAVFVGLKKAVKEMKELTKG